MGGVIFIGAAVVAVSAAMFYLGSKYGAEIERRAVAEALAKYRSDTASRNFVHKILMDLHADYTTAYVAVVDAIEQVEIDAKKVL